MEEFALSCGLGGIAILRKKGIVGGVDEQGRNAYARQVGFAAGLRPIVHSVLESMKRSCVFVIKFPKGPHLLQSSILNFPWETSHL